MGGYYRHRYTLNKCQITHLESEADRRHDPRVSDRSDRYLEFVVSAFKGTEGIP